MSVRQQINDLRKAVEKLPPSPIEWQLNAAQFLLEVDVVGYYFDDDPSVENVAERWCEHAETVGLKPAQAELHRERAFGAIANETRAATARSSNVPHSGHAPDTFAVRS